MTAALVLRAVDELPRIGWVAKPTPITDLPSLADELGLSWLGVKRDDLCAPLPGGSKIRKLDYLLSEARWQEATTWQTVGAIGSAQLVLCAAAARQLGHRLRAHTFWMPPDDLIIERLAAAVSLGTELTYHHNRTTLALFQPRSLMPPPLGQGNVIPPGTTSAVANLGCRQPRPGSRRPRVGPTGR